MATHPKKAVPGAVPGRRTVLPLSRLGEVYALAAFGCTIEEIAEGLGVNRSTLLRRRKRAPEFIEALKRGRAEFNYSVQQGGLSYARLLAERHAARAVEEQHERRIELQLARVKLEVLLGEAPHPTGTKPVPPESAPVSLAVRPGTGATSRLAAEALSKTRQRGEINAFGSAHHFDGDPVPLVDPLAEDRDDDDNALPLDEPF